MCLHVVEEAGVNDGVVVVVPVAADTVIQVLERAPGDRHVIGVINTHTGRRSGYSPWGARIS